MKPRSMEEKISYRLFWMGFVGLICTTVLCLFVFHRAFREQAWAALENEASLVAAGCEQIDDPAQLSAYVNGDLRITLIASDGSVLFESATSQQMENHLGRPEIQQAKQKGVGRDRRDSQTLGYETYYYAMLLPDGDILRVAQDSETIWSIYDAALPAIVLSCIVMMGAAAMMAGLLTRSLVQPILKMTDDLEHIQENVPYKELIPFAESIHSDRLLRENNEKMRQDFTANVSHELKTPLAGIRLLTDSILQTDHMDEETTKEFVTDIGREAERLSRITENLLRLTRLDSGVVQQPYPVAVRPVLERVERMLTMVAQEKGVTVSGAADEDAVALATDDDVHQILYNLMENAIKYSAAEDGFVRAEAHVDGDKVVLTVSDNGIGIPDEDLPHIFDRFYRVDKMRSREVGGTGLGLSIVKDTIENRGGTISAGHGANGVGTVFTVYLPLAERGEEA